MADCVTHIKAGVAVVTGAGSGLGRALAIELADRGMKVVGFGRRLDALKETATLTPDGQFFPMQLDVSDGEGVREAFRIIAATHGPVTLLINNAGVYPHRDIFDETVESFMDTMSKNLGGTFACSREALENMSETGIGRIINVSSFADIAPLPASSAYAVSKGAGQIFTRALTADLADRFPNIVVSTWMPGMLATDMGVSHGLSPNVAAKWGVNLAFMHDPSLNGVVFEMDTEVPPARGLKQKLKDLLRLRRTPQKRRL
jgi:NAD(P)-dependent dehydrogenase (short-subunit alcohol dehydrogenase family)